MDRDQQSATAASDEDGEGGEQLLSIAEAALRYGVPAREVTKLAYRNQLDGARKVRGAHGMEWRVPAAELEARGFHRQDEPSAAVPPEAAELQRSVRRLTDTLIRERARWADKQRELETALLEIGKLRSQVKEEQRRRQQAGQKLTELAHALIELAEATAADTTVDLRTSEEQKARQVRAVAHIANLVAEA